MIIFEVLRQNDNFVARVFLVTISLVFISVFQVVECFKLIRHDRSIHLKAIVFFVIILSTFIGLRFFKALKVTDPQTGYLYQEVGLAFYLRIITYAIYLLIIISISNYFYEKLWFRADALAHLNEDKMLMSLKQLALARDNETGQHVVRTQNYVKALAQRLTRMGYFTNELSENAVELLFKAAPLHDIGKVGIPDKILLKKGKLTPAEWEIMKTHTLIGESVLSSAGLSIEQDAYEDVIEKAIKIAGGHHEKWDGTGYPRALVGEQIPLEARIMAIADMYDALVSERVYKKAWLHEDAVNEILYKKGTHFDPKVVDAFLLESHRFREIAEEFRD
jgi:HD-GYP domain-containing protein (c-di-GMP phosphodiesterase class II)